MVLGFCVGCKTDVFFRCFLLLGLIALTNATPTVYLIRHGEKPVSGSGLNPQGLERSQCLINVFGAKSHYNISHIMAQKPKENGKQQRPYDTVEPLARSRNMTVDTSCQRDDTACVANVVHNYTGPGNILICWEHKRLTDIMTALGDANAPTYPHESFDIIWENPVPYNNVVGMTSECCPGLDDHVKRPSTTSETSKRDRLSNVRGNIRLPTDLLGCPNLSSTQ